MNVLQQLFNSKKAVVAFTGILVSVFVLLKVPEELATKIAAIVMGGVVAYVGAQGAADWGKHAKAIEVVGAPDESDAG